MVLYYVLHVLCALALVYILYMLRKSTQIQRDETQRFRTALVPAIQKIEDELSELSRRITQIEKGHHISTVENEGVFGGGNTCMLKENLECGSKIIVSDGNESYVFRRDISVENDNIDSDNDSVFVLEDAPVEFKHVTSVPQIDFSTMHTLSLKTPDSVTSCESSKKDGSVLDDDDMSEISNEDDIGEIPREPEEPLTQDEPLVEELATCSISKLQRMTVDQLRKMVIFYELLDEETAESTKKADLLVLLKNKKNTY